MSAPAPVPALPDTERRTAYTIGAQKGPFAVNFAIYGDSIDYAEWVEVWLNGIQLASNAWVMTSPSGSIATLPRPITDAVITLVAAGTGNLQIVGARRPRRTSQFTENRGVAARDLNQVLTDAIAQLREVWDRTRSRMFSVPGGEIVTQLPSAALRANTVFGFDGAGNPIMQPIVPTGGLSVIPLTLTRSQIPSVTLTVNTLLVSGYAAPGDAGAGAMYSSNGASSSSPGAIQDAAGTWFGLVIIAAAKVAWFGAKGDGSTDDTAAILAAIASLGGGGTVSLMAGGAVHLVTSTINLPANVNLIGGGAGSLFSEVISPPMTTIKCSAAVTIDHLLDCDPIGHRYSGTVSGIVFDCNHHAQSGLFLHAAQGSGWTDVVVTQVNGGNGIWLDIGTYPFPASENVFQRVHVLNLTGGATGLLVTNMSGNSFYNCHFDGGFTNGVAVWVKSLSDTNSFFNCGMTCFGAGGIAYKVDGAGFNNNVFGGSVQTSDGLGTEVWAGSNTFKSHLWGVYLAFGATIYTDAGNGHMHFHDCYYPNGSDRYDLIGAVTITSTVDFFNNNPFTIELMFWGTITAIKRIRNGAANSIGVLGTQIYFLTLDPGDGVNVTHTGLTASAMPH